MGTRSLGPAPRKSHARRAAGRAARGSV